MRLAAGWLLLCAWLAIVMRILILIIFGRDVANHISDRAVPFDPGIPCWGWAGHVILGFSVMVHELALELALFLLYGTTNEIADNDMNVFPEGITGNRGRKEVAEQFLVSAAPKSARITQPPPPDPARLCRGWVFAAAWVANRRRKWGRAFKRRLRYGGAETIGRLATWYVIPRSLQCQSTLRQLGQRRRRRMRRQKARQLHAADSIHLQVPSLRGGGGKDKSLAEVLAEVIAKEETKAKACEVRDPDAALRRDLSALLQRDPPNLLQELKSLVTKHTKGASAANPMATESKGKGKGKGKGPQTAAKLAPVRQVLLEDTPREDGDHWNTVTRKKPKKPATAKDAWTLKRELWRAPSSKALGFINSASELAAELDSSTGVAWIMCTSDSVEALEAAALVAAAQNDETSHSLAILYGGKAADLDHLEPLVTSIPVPGSEAGRLVVRKFWCHSVGSSPAVLTSRTSAPLTVKAPPAPLKSLRNATYVVRASFD